MTRFLAFATIVFLAYFLVPMLSAFGHEEYEAWKIPGTGASCCNGLDCRPVRAEQDADGNWIAWVNGVPRKIPPTVVLPFKANDGRSHFCGNDTQIYCFTAGEIRS